MAPQPSRTSWPSGVSSVNAFGEYGTHGEPSTRPLCRSSTSNRPLAPSATWARPCEPTAVAKLCPPDAKGTNRVTPPGWSTINLPSLGPTLACGAVAAEPAGAVRPRMRVAAAMTAKRRRRYPHAALPTLRAPQPSA